MTLLRVAPLAAALAVGLLAGCATKAPSYDYSAFQKASPATLLVMPPVNESLEVKATAGVWAQATRPLAEAGYYVLPVTLVDETFRGNGITSADEAQAIPYTKLREYFGADAAVNIRVRKYGTSYQVVASETRVEVEARILDLRTGEQLWDGRAVASSSEQSKQQGLIADMISAVIEQIVSTVTDASFSYAGVANARLFVVPRSAGVLPGPRSPLHGQVPASR